MPPSHLATFIIFIYIFILFTFLLFMEVVLVYCIKFKKWILKHIYVTYICLYVCIRIHNIQLLSANS